MCRRTTPNTKNAGRWRLEQLKPASNSRKYNPELFRRPTYQYVSHCCRATSYRTRQVRWLPVREQIKKQPARHQGLVAICSPHFIYRTLPAPLTQMCPPSARTFPSFRAASRYCLGVLAVPQTEIRWRRACHAERLGPPPGNILCYHFSVISRPRAGLDTVIVVFFGLATNTLNVRNNNSNNHRREVTAFY